jgi:hypothetical protein
MDKKLLNTLLNMLLIVMFIGVILNSLIYKWDLVFIGFLCAGVLQLIKTENRSYSENVEITETHSINHFGNTKV